MLIEGHIPLNIYLNKSGFYKVPYPPSPFGRGQEGKKKRGKRKKKRIKRKKKRIKRKKKGERKDKRQFKEQKGKRREKR